MVIAMAINNLGHKLGKFTYIEQQQYSNTQRHIRNNMNGITNLGHERNCVTDPVNINHMAITAIPIQLPRRLTATTDSITSDCQNCANE